MQRVRALFKYTQSKVEVISTSGWEAHCGVDVSIAANSSPSRNFTLVDGEFGKQCRLFLTCSQELDESRLCADHTSQRGICWSSISNGRCKELLSQGVTKEDCCASNAAAATAYSEEDLDSGSLFFWRVLGGGVQCRPCRESCAEVRCEEGKKCVVRRGRPRCVCSPECKAPRGGGPVCGTDGKSYKNLCRLKKRACKKGSHELAVAYNGHCQSSCARVRCGQGRSCLLDQNLSPHCVRCARRCPQPPPQQRAAARPVCGADGNTYKSACHLRLAACRAGRAIPVAYKGHCKLYFPARVRFTLEDEFLRERARTRFALSLEQALPVASHVKE
ncbi:hypothetical protein K0M31_014039 [Melipona bicolor]|uniref:Follistatin n=1 Tax=Melipona bicolor TaxID=60889 RepID=A0AA40G7Q1_9HYME|nr:hypothetical protein K0M31_014039 [Melipona bicolor]